MNRRRMSKGLGLALLAAAVSISGDALAQQAPDVACAPGQMRCTTQAQRAAAAVRAKELRKNKPRPRPPVPGGVPDYYGTDPNWAWTPPLKKFVDTLPQVGVANNLGQMITVGVPDTRTFPGSDYYEIAVRDFCEQMHSDFPAVTVKDGRGCQGGTLIRGYVQLNNGTNAGGTAEDVAPAAQHYLGPVLVAQMDRPIRIKFVNQVTPGTGGNLFIPTDITAMGADRGIDWKNGGAEKLFSQNRATLHLHGGDNPWISDGTPHQWTAPVGENGATTVLKGVSTAYVPDMWFTAAGAVIPSCAKSLTCAVAGATNNPGAGAMTFYYPNQQSARLMFYHDHAYGITRLNVTVGEAAGYLIQDPVEQKLVNGGTIGGLAVAAGTVPAGNIPIIIQDRSFVDANGTLATNPNHVLNNDPTWNWGRSAPIPVTGDFWFPHVMMPNQNPADMSGANAVGRWDYGPMFWPVFSPVAHPPLLPDGVACLNTTGYDPEFFRCPATPNPSLVPEGFSDTPIVNGTAYPVLNVEPKAYRLRILNASNDRSLNLSLFQASGLAVAITNPGAELIAGTYPVTVDGCTGSVASLAVTPNPDPTKIGAIATALTVTTQPTSCSGPITVNFGAIPTDPLATAPVAPQAVAAWNTEVKMIPAVTGWPGNPPLPPLYQGDTRVWPTDNRVGGVPDPTTVGPDFLVIGSEAGLLPELATIPANPTNYNYNRRDIVVLNVSEHGLFMQPAERYDAVVDFSAFAGKTLILYNDAPSPVPASDPRNDYFTGNPDFSMATGDGTGGHATTLPGYGPNTRTIMQIQVAAGTPVPFDKVALAAALPKAFAASQPPPIVPEPEHGAAYGKNINWAYGRIQSTSLSWVPLEFAAPAGSPYATGPKTTFPLQPKAIQELFEMDYGRMNATLGVELPFTNSVNQTTIPYGFIDPLTETYAGTTQLWKITHNGVDSHPVHFHLYNVQVLNRVGWDGAIRPAEPQEKGWKETVRMNPLEDVVVAARPLLPELPFPLPDSIRPLDVTRALGTSGPQYTNVDPKTGNPVTVVNANFNFGHEYVWHCHILGHEENDFMRPMRAQKVANDFNYDQWPDFLWRNKTTSTTSFWLIKNFRQIGTAGTTSIGTAWEYSGTGDFDNDGNADLIIRNKTTGQNAIWYYSGTKFRSSVLIAGTPDLNWKVVAVADFDGDGYVDLLYRNSSTGQNAVWLMKKTTFVRSVNLPAFVGSTNEVVGANDFDGDGTPDIAWRNNSTGVNQVWYINNLSGAISQKAVATLPSGPDATWRLVTVGDFNQDAQPDLLFRQTTGAGLIKATFLSGILPIGTANLNVGLSDQNWEIIGPK